MTEKPDLEHSILVARYHSHQVNEYLSGAYWATSSRGYLIEQALDNFNKLTLALADLKLARVITQEPSDAVN